MVDRSLDGEPVDVVVGLRWDDYNTALFVEKLFRHVRREELRFDLEARSGSVETSFAVSVAPGMTVEVVENVARYLLRRSTRADHDLADPDVELLVDGESRPFTLEEEDDVRDIVREAHAKVRDEDQRELDDFSR